MNSDMKCVRELLVTHRWSVAKVADVLSSQYSRIDIAFAEDKNYPYQIPEPVYNRIVRRALGKSLKTIRLAKRVKRFGIVSKYDHVPLNV